MSKREAIAARKLAETEIEFSALLRTCLQQCAAGRWGLFGQNQHPEAERWLRWPAARRLSELATKIRSMRQSFGTVNPECERFLYYASLRGANVPGEPKLAKAMLEELRGATEK